MKWIAANPNTATLIFYAVAIVLLSTVLSLNAKGKWKPVSDYSREQVYRFISLGSVGLVSVCVLLFTTFAKGSSASAQAPFTYAIFFLLVVSVISGVLMKVEEKRTAK